MKWWRAILRCWSSGRTSWWFARSVSVVMFIMFIASLFDQLIILLFTLDGGGLLTCHCWHLLIPIINIILKITKLWCLRGPLRSETGMERGHRHYMPSLQRRVHHIISRLSPNRLILQMALSGRRNWSSQKSAGEVRKWEEHSYLHLATFPQVNHSHDNSLSWLAVIIWQRETQFILFPMQLWKAEVHCSCWPQRHPSPGDWSLNWNQDWNCISEMKVIREAIYKSIRNDANYSAEEMKKKVVKEFQDQYLLKVNMRVIIQLIINICVFTWQQCWSIKPIHCSHFTPEEYCYETFSIGCWQWPVFLSWLPHISVQVCSTLFQCIIPVFMLILFLTWVTPGISASASPRQTPPTSCWCPRRESTALFHTMTSICLVRGL